MKKLLVFITFLTACGPDVERSPNSKVNKTNCNVLCLKKYGTKVDFVGGFSGTCYCK